MYRAALERAAKKGIKQILYLGDFDPSGLLIDQVAAREMSIQVTRIGLTQAQVKKYRPPSVPVNRKDSRAKDYIKRFGNRCWEVESLRPRTLLRLVEGEFSKYVPREYLVKAEARERAATISKPLLRRLTREIHHEVLRLMETQLSANEIQNRLAEEYGLKLKDLQHMDRVEHV
jgi:hypothetical protein